ncbi:GPP34 family phosphoprotein [Streptomyces sp. NPDC050548]|uniref:GPP34 family phosphoprotein n=1 Tax=Streptomyces sp. NPDC050548 TaxID=3365629 RepID=UPI0037A39209
MDDDLPCLMYLLAYDDSAEGPYDRARTRLLVRAATLVDLAARGRPGEDGGRDWKRLVRRHRRRTLTEVEDRLVAAGVLTVRAPRTPFGRRRATVTDRATPAAVRVRVSEALHGDVPVTELPVADAALLALAAAGGIRPVVSRRDRKTYRARIDACTDSLAALAPGLDKAVRTLPTTMIAGQGGMGGG